MNRCEYDPINKRPAQSVRRPDRTWDHQGCQNETTMCVGAKGQWHLCDECAALPEFKRFRKRTPLNRHPPLPREAE